MSKIINKQIKKFIDIEKKGDIYSFRIVTPRGLTFPSANARLVCKQLDSEARTRLELIYKHGIRK